jgi:hypothetical protein
MKFVVASCAVLVWLGCGQAQCAPLRGGADPSDEVAPRPPAAIPHARVPGAVAAVPLPRRKPDAAPPATPAPSSVVVSPPD